MYVAANVVLQDYRGALANQPEPPAESFRSYQDAFNFASYGIEERNRFLTIYNLGRVIENYREGNLAVCVRVRFQSRAAEYDLVFLSVESEFGDDKRDRHSRRSKCGLPCDIVELHRNQAGMLFGVGKFVQSPKGVIPSLVRLELAKKRTDFRGQVDDALEAVFQVGSVLRDRKVGEPIVGLSAEVKKTGRVAGLVEAGPQVVDGVKDDTGQLVEPVGEPEFVDVCRSVDVALDVARPRLLVYDCLKPGIEVGNVVLCTTERAFGAGKRVHMSRLAKPGPTRKLRRP